LNADLDAAITRAMRAPEKSVRLRLGPLALALTLGGAARAGDPPRPIEPARLAGTAAFEWSNGRKCKTVDAALIKRWDKGYLCMPPEEGVGTASGKPAAAVCKAHKGRSEFLVFRLMADCVAERETQMANE
jgi:hypothetical protein